MTVDDLLDAIGEIDEADMEIEESKPKRRKIMWTGIGSLAACFLLFLFLPWGFLRQNMLNDKEVNYAPKDYTSFSVYYVDGDTLSQFMYEIHGGYEEMFFAWKNQNGIGNEVELKNFVLESTTGNNSDQGENKPNGGYFLRVTVSSAFSEYLKKDSKGLLTEALKKTVASYVGVPVCDMEWIFTE